MSEKNERSESVLTDNADHFLNNDDLNDALKLQKDQQYHCMNKLDQQFNASQIQMINQHQDTEFNEAMLNVETLMNICMLNIHKNDGLITCANPNYFMSPSRLTTSSKGKKGYRNEFSFETASLENSTTSNDADKSIIIDSLIPLDFVRNGLRSGPLQARLNEPQLPHEQTSLTNSDRKSIAQTQSATQSAAAIPPALSRSNTQANISLATQLNYKILMPAKCQVIFKYLLAIDLNSDYFDCQIINDKEAIYSIKSVKQPLNWTKCDYNSLTLDIQSTHKEPLNKIFSNIVGLKSEINPRKLPKIAPVKYLNSRALFDRLYKHFYRTIIKEWSSMESYNLKFGDECRACEIKDNQLKIMLKHKGSKQKDLDIIIYLNIGIKYTDEIIDSKTLDSMVLISNNFFQNGGFYIKPPVITRNSMIQIINWMYKNLRINLSTIYLVPNCIHYYSLYLLPLKLNFLVWLIWLNGFNHRSVGTDLILGLFNGEDKSNSAQLKLLVANHLTNKGSIMKTNQTLPLLMTNPMMNSNLFLLIRMIQLFNYLSLSKNEITSSMDNHTAAEEELIADLALLEMSSNSRSQRARHGSSELWSSENLFERFWSCLIKYRSAMIVEHILPDPFRIFRNALPCLFIKHITLQFYNRIQLFYAKNSILSNENASNESSSQIDPTELRMCIETTMKLLFVNIVNDDTRELRNLSQSKSHSIVLSDIKRQNTMNLPVSMINTIGSNIDYNDV